jgi:hypothetical protein
MAKKNGTSRIYSVVRKGHGNVRLVRSKSWHSALRHVATDEYAISTVREDDLVEAIRRGVAVEQANDIDTIPLPAATPPSPVQVLVMDLAKGVVDLVGQQGAGDVVGDQGPGAPPYFSGGPVSPGSEIDQRPIPASGEYVVPNPKA